MAKRLILGLVLAGVLVLGYLGYVNWKQNRAMLSGEVTGGPPEPVPSEPYETRPQASPLQSARPQSAPAPASPSPKASANVPETVADSAPVEMPPAAPESDTLAPNPPNGMAYAGSGRFQVYRQGNLTYRIDTDTGQSCVLYATTEEWRKPLVYTHGCANGPAR